MSADDEEEGNIQFHETSFLVVGKDCNEKFAQITDHALRGLRSEKDKWKLMTLIDKIRTTKLKKLCGRN